MGRGGRRGAATLVLGVGLVLSACSGPSTSPGAAAAAPASTAPVHGCPDGYVALTFDDGPTVEFTPKILAALEGNGQVRATFFNTGANEEAHPDLVRAEQAAGMWFGNHTYSHPHLTQLAADARQQELTKAAQVHRKITGTTASLFRPPFDDTDPQVAAASAALGMTEVIWTVDTHDYDGLSAQQIVANALTVKPGGIVLMHDGYQTTVDALPAIVDGLAQRGLCAGQVVRSPSPVVTDWGQSFSAVAAHW